MDTAKVTPLEELEEGSSPEHASKKTLETINQIESQIEHSNSKLRRDSRHQWTFDGASTIGVIEF